jgi:hypothetical protein
MDKRRAKEAIELFDENVRQKRLDLSGDEALAAARDEVIKIVRHTSAQIRREKLLQIARTKDILQKAESSGLDIGRVMQAHLDFDPGVKGVANLAKRRESIRGLLHQRLDKFLAAQRRTIMGNVRDPALLMDIQRELHGKPTGSVAARDMAKAWGDTAETARRMFNRAGGDIPKLEGWALPHTHNAIAIRAAGFDEWYSTIKPRLDMTKMRDQHTGQAFNEVTFRAAMERAYDNIVTDGWKGREAGATYGQKLARRRLDHRFLIFKSADDWSAYHERFGEGDVFSMMMGHLDSMSRDIAALQILGPNPTATVRWMGDIVEKDLRVKASRSGIRTDKPESRARSVRKSLDLMYEHFTGQVNSPIHGKAARTFAGMRHILQSAQLGAAALSALSDIGFARLAAREVGIPYRKVLARHVELLSPHSVEDRKLAVRLGLIADHWSTLASAQQRYLGEVSGPEVSRRIADFVMRVSGLSPWTQAGRWAFGMEFSGLLADNAGKTLRQLPKELQTTFERAGISSHDWNLARKSSVMEHKGATFLRPEDIGNQEVALKFLDMFHTETEFAIPSASLRGRTLLVGEGRPGTIQGELTRSFAMYKNFAVTIMMTHMRRGMAMPTAGQKGRYFAQFFLSTALTGAFALQMKEIAKGRDPRNMMDARFWGAAELQGGGLGIFGDFFFSQKNRFDQGIARTIAGPVAGLVGDVVGFTNDNVRRAIEGKDTKIASGVIDLAERYAPGGSIWWYRLGVQNLIFDEMRRFADPDFGQDYWASRSRDTVRLPDLEAAFGQ